MHVQLCNWSCGLRGRTARAHAHPGRHSSSVSLNFVHCVSLASSARAAASIASNLQVEERSAARVCAAPTLTSLVSAYDDVLDCLDPAVRAAARLASGAMACKGGLGPAATKKVVAELVELTTRKPCEGITVQFSEQNVCEVLADIDGPVGTPYEHGVFRIRLSLSPDYPHSPPKGHFLTKTFHPNVSEAGEICVNVLKKDWKPDLGIRHVLMVGASHPPHMLTGERCAGRGATCSCRTWSHSHLEHSPRPPTC